MSGRVDIDFAVGEGAVVRMLGLVERRGFMIRGIEMREQGDRGILTLEIAPRDDGRRLDVLELQLRRLHEVRDVATTSLAGTVQS